MTIDTPREIELKARIDEINAALSALNERKRQLIKKLRTGQAQHPNER